MQVLWVLWVVVAPPSPQIPLWVLFMIGELLVPDWAERSGATTWHPHHIAERHGLFTLFVLGLIAALGAGLAASVDYDLHISHAPGTAVAAFTTVPLALFFLCVWYVQDCPGQDGLRKYLLPIGAVAVLPATFGPAPIHVTAGIALVLVVVTRLVQGQPQRVEV